MENQKVYLDISWTTIFKLVSAFFFLYLIYLLINILIWFLFAMVISMLFNPLIDYFEKKKIPRIVSIIFFYGTVFGILALSIYLTVPIFLQEAQQLSQSLKYYLQRFPQPFKTFGIEAGWNLEKALTQLQQFLSQIGTNIFNALFVIFGNIATTLFVIGLAIFLSLEKKPIERAILLLSPSKYEKENLAIWRASQKKVAGWFFSRVIACIFVGAVCFLAFWLLKLDYPFSLAFVGGVLNFIPMLGPLIAAILIFLVGISQSLLVAILSLLAFVIIQQIENNLLSPILAKKFIGLSPVLVLIAFAAGAKLWGILGAVLTIPLLGAIIESIKAFLRIKKAKEKTKIEPLLKETPQEPPEDKTPLIF